jgi:hypothetical protein
MTARSGKIGKESPWYVSDYGLTQTNNSGTIFLGNPGAPSDITSWVDIATDAQFTILPNGLDGPATRFPVEGTDYTSGDTI